MKANRERRMATLEAKAKQRVISISVDFMMLANDDMKVELSQELQELVEMAAQEEEAADGSCR